MQDNDLGTISLGDTLEDLIPAIRQKLEQGEAHERHLRELADEQKSENVKMRRALSVIDPTYVHPNSPKTEKANRPKKPQPSHVGVPRANGTATGFGISLEKAKECADKILEFVDEGNEFVTQKDIYKALDWDQTKGSAAFRFLREIKFLRKAGKTSDSRRDRFAVMDRDALDKMIAEVKGDA